MRRVEKPWGYEIVFAENEKYAGKILHVEAGHALSLQYHERKDETLYVLKGEVTLLVDADAEADADPDKDGKLTEVTLGAGDSYRIRPGVRHRMSATAPCDLVEVSSPELDDVVRLEDRYGREGTSAP